MVLGDYQVDNKLINTDMPVLLSSRNPDTNKANIMNKIVHIVKHEIKDIFNRRQTKGSEYFFKFHVIFDKNNAIGGVGGGQNSLLLRSITLFKLFIKPIEVNLDGILIDILMGFFQSMIKKISAVRLLINRFALFIYYFYYSTYQLQIMIMKKKSNLMNLNWMIYLIL